MGSFVPRVPNYEYPDLVQRLTQMFLQGEVLKRQQQLQEAELARRSRLETEAAEETRRRREREDVEQQVSLAELERGAAARQPQLPLGGEPLPGALPGPPTEAESVGARGALQTITLPSGQRINLGPLRSRTELEAEEKRKAGEALLQSLQQLGLKEELTQSIRAKYAKPTRGGDFDQFVTAKYGEKPTPQQLLSARREWEGAGRKPEDIGAAAEKEIEAKALAEAWAEGRAFPTSQVGTTHALAYMEKHPDQFPRKPRKLTADQQNDVLRGTDALATIEDVETAYQKVKDKVGPVTYAFNEFTRRLPFTAEDPDFVTFNTFLRGMGNLEIKRITGAQMSEAEADRLLKGMATGSLKPADFEAAIAVMKRNATRNREVLLYGSASKAKPETLAAGGTPSKTVGKYKILSVE